MSFQTLRDLLKTERTDLRQRIATEGAGAAILSARADAGWSREFYEPKWTCPHYALLGYAIWGFPAAARSA